ncbi:MAG TPA: Gfo/Idh/MocA family oxidoreductase [Gammaproteobacteria bacterium]
MTGSAALAASGIYSPHVFALSRKRRIGVALVGLGYYSRDLLAPALQLTQYCHLAGIVTGSPEKIPVWQKKYGIADKNVYSYDNMHRIADNPDIDVIYIVLPTSLHEKYSVIAANAGKHVWCEKPMAMTVAECESIIGACNKNKVQLTIGYRLQHEPNTRTVMQYAASKPFGKIKHVTAKAGYYDASPNPDHWRMKKAMGGGAMYDMGTYPLNAARYSTGEFPVAISARHERKRPELFKEVDETAYFDLVFPGGATAECMASVGENVNILNIDCEKGWYKLEPFQSYTGVSGITSTGVALDKTVNNQQARQMDDDALAILENIPPLVPGEEGMKEIALIQAAIKSVEGGGKTIRL